MSPRGRLSAALLLPAMLACSSCVAEHPAGVPAELAGIPASKFCKEVKGTDSPDGRFAVAVGYSKPEAVDWGKLRNGDSYDFDRDSPLLINAIIDRKRDRALAVSPTGYFGTKESYNHDRLIAAWSGTSNYLIVVESAKWWSSAWLWALDHEGRPTAQLDLASIAKRELHEVQRQKSAKAAALFDSRYETVLEEPRVDDAGAVSFRCWASAGVSLEYAVVSLKVRFKAKPAAVGKLAVTDLVDSGDEGE